MRTCWGTPTRFGCRFDQLTRCACHHWQGDQTHRWRYWFIQHGFGNDMRSPTGKQLPSTNERQTINAKQGAYKIEAQRASARARFTKVVKDTITVKCTQPTCPLGVSTASLVELLQIILFDYDWGSGSKEGWQSIRTCPLSKVATNYGLRIIWWVHKVHGVNWFLHMMFCLYIVNGIVVVTLWMALILWIYVFIFSIALSFRIFVLML